MESLVPSLSGLFLESFTENIQLHSSYSLNCNCTIFKNQLIFIKSVAATVLFFSILVLGGYQSLKV